MTTVIEVVGPAVGGIRKHVTELVRQARAAGLDITVAGPAEADVIIPLAGASRPWGVVGAAMTIARTPGDLVHAHGMTAGWAAVLARSRFAGRSRSPGSPGSSGSAARRPLVLTAHNVVLGRSPLGRLEGPLYRRCDVVLAPSAALAGRIRRLAPATTVREIVPTYPTPSPSRSRAEVRSQLEVTDEVALVVVPARMHPQKDHETVVRAIAALGPTSGPTVVLFVGDGPSRPSVAALVDQLGLSERISLLGHRDDVADLLAAADLVLIGSHWEAVPLVVLEAMTLGVAVISSDVGIVGELVDPDGPVLRVVPIGDVAAMAAALADLLADRPARTALGRRGATVAARYSPVRLGAAVLDVYAELVG